MLGRHNVWAEQRRLVVTLNATRLTPLSSDVRSLSVNYFVLDGRANAPIMGGRRRRWRGSSRAALINSELGTVSCFQAGALWIQLPVCRQPTQPE